ncbi:unnamed protein product [Cuscuta campestris]|uniref:DUF4219 domain-containing protein n=1 Tax=Cuscuta campestris TaxID=132261 RepID=A0A484ML86_9ASTE|nr:unnamed protein product [Cuscuta campestris]
MASRMFNAGVTEGQSTTRPPLFDGTNYSYWKERMRIFIQSNDYKLWLIVKNGCGVPMKKVGEVNVPKTEEEFNDEDCKKMELNAKAINMIYCGVNADDYRKISRCETAKQMWEKLEVTYEGTAQVREAKIDHLTHEYELFSMKENEKIEEMFERMPRCKNASSRQETAAEESERPWRREGSKYIHIQTGLAFNTGASAERFHNMFLTKEIVSPKIVDKDLFKSATYAPSKSLFSQQDSRDLKFRNSSNPSVINLTLIQRVQQYIFSYVLLPRDSNHGVVNKDDIRLFHVLLNNVKFDWVHFFVVALSDGTRFSHLRFAIPIMHILARSKVDFTRDTQVPVKKTCFITEAKFTRTVYREVNEQNLDLVIPDEVERETEAESSQAGGSRTTERVTRQRKTRSGEEAP